MIESASFVNDYSGQVIDFNSDELPFTRFTMEVDVRSQNREKAQQHGTWRGNTYFGKRVFHLEGDITTIDSPSYIALRRDVLRTLMPHIQGGKRISGTLKILFSGMGEEMQADCSLDGYPEIPMEALSPARTPYQINLKSNDPRLYGATLLEETILAASEGTGRGYPKVYPKLYSPPVTSTAAAIGNDGELESYPIVTFYGPSSGPSIILSRASLGLPSLTLSLPDLVLSGPTEYVTVDFSERTAMLPDGGDVYSFVEGSWWALEPGANTVQYSAYVLGAGSKAVVQWRNAYML